MTPALRNAWQSRSPRARAIIAVVAALLAIVLCAWFMQSAGRARAQLHASVASLRTQAARLDQQAIEVERLRAAPGATASPTDLRKLVEARVGAAGLSRVQVRIEATDSEHVVVVFGAVAFADLLNWIAGLQQQQVRIDAGRIEALAAPGLVSATATLARPKQK